MKKMILTALLAGVAVFSAKAQAANLTEAQYICIAQQMQMINSDIYYDLSRTDIDTMLDIPEFTGHTEAVASAHRCGVN